MRKSILLFSFFIFFSSFSQELPEIVSPSPTAASLGKYGEIPVGFNIGVPSVSIPLYEVNGMDIQVPITLNYHASGIRVEDNASWVGLGWSLDAGGVITRSVRGLPDESANGIRYYSLPTEMEINSVDQASNISQYFGPQTSPDGLGVKDREPDLFYYNFSGASGKIYFDENNIVVSKPYTNLKIEPFISGNEIDYWIITDQSGVKYYFGTDNTIYGAGEERIANGSQPTFTSAWYLTRIFNPKTDSDIFFEYDDNISKVEKPKSESLEWYFYQPIFTDPAFGGLNNLPMNPAFQTSLSNKTVISGNRILKKIIFPNGIVEFTTTNNRTDIEDEIELSKIEVFNKFNESQKSYHFEYDYSGKLYLKKIIEYDKFNQEQKPYVFDYFTKIPNGSTNNQDFWGFYNGANNSNLIPTLYAVNNPYGQYQADRLPNEEAMKNGTLKKITYPTKGSTEFEFEAHRAFTPKFYDSYSPFLLNNKEDVSLISVQGEYKEEFFTIETSNEQNILFEIDFTYFREEYNTNRPAVYLHKNENGVWIDVKSWWPTYPSLEDQSFKDIVELFPGDYKFVMTDMSCAAPPCYVARPDELEKRFVTYAKFSYLKGSDNDFKDKEIIAGGLRVHKIINRATDGTILSQKKYTYEHGKLITFPIHYSTYQQEMWNKGFYDVHYHCWRATGIGEYTVYSISSSSMAPLGASQGSHVIYSKVIEESTDIDQNVNGYIEYYYYIPDDDLDNPLNIPSDPPYAPQDDISDIANKLYKKIILNSNNDTIQKKIYDYSFISNDIPSHSVKGLSIFQKRRSPLSAEGSCSSYTEKAQSYFFYYAFYDIETSWIKLNSVITADFDESGLNPITSTIQNYYDNNQHLLPTRTETVINNGKLILAKTIYPDDVLTATTLQDNTPIEGGGLDVDYYNAIKKLQSDDLHQINVPVQVENIIKENDGTKLSQTIQRTNYYTTDDGLTLPREVQVLKGVNSTIQDLETKLVYHDYDNHGNPIEVSKADGTHIYYIWGYNQQYPIAKIDNFESSDITTDLQNKINSAVLASNLDNSTCKDGCNEATLRNALEAIRVAIPKAQMTYYTYDPLIGVTSITDPRGYTTYYEYDDFNRLKQVKDAEGNIVTGHEYHYKNQEN